MRRGDAKPRRAARLKTTADPAKECAGSARARSPAKRRTHSVVGREPDY